MSRQEDLLNAAAPVPAVPDDDPRAIAAHFTAPEQIVDLALYGEGLINDSYLVRRRDDPPFLLQRLNPRVFPEPDRLMHNLRRVSEHLLRKQRRNPAYGAQQALRLLPTQARKDCHYDRDGACWRALHFVENSRTLTGITSEPQARAAGTALGRFQALLHDLPPAELYDTLPTLHVIPCALRHYDQVAAGCSVATWSVDQRHCRRFIEQRRPAAVILEQARARGVLPERVIHGDPKLSNILFAADGNDGDRALAMIDLDTVKPGLSQYDIGDCLRSCCNPAGSDPADPAAATFDLNLARALLTGYLAEMRALLTYSDFAYFYQAVRLIAWELGIRFFTDYLAGNRYFKVGDPEQNLRRALTQFRLVDSIEEQERQLRLIIKELT